MYKGQNHFYIKRPVALVGMPGSGKSTIGRKLARILNFRFIDSDELIEQEAGKKISDIFKDSGESTFRAMEMSTILNILETEDVPYILSTGGGAVITPDIYNALQQKTILVYFNVSTEELWRRLALEKDYISRPLLSQTDDHPKKRLEELMEKRSAVYGQSHIVIDCDGKEPGDIVEETIQKIGDL